MYSFAINNNNNNNNMRQNNNYRSGAYGRGGRGGGGGGKFENSSSSSSGIPSSSAISSSYPPLTQAWLDAIESATACLRTNNNSSKSNNNNNNDADNEEELFRTIDASIDYLATLEADLATIKSNKWQSPPSRSPPPFIPNRTADEHYGQDATTMMMGGGGGYHPLVPSQVVPAFRGVASNNNNNNNNNNPFASIALSDDEEDDEEEEEEETTLDVDDEAGDAPVLNTKHNHRKSTAGAGAGAGGMSVLRLLIRIGTSNSDLWAYKGNAMASSHQWTLGAAALQCAIQSIRQALELADTQISKYYHHHEHEHEHYQTFNEGGSDDRAEQQQRQQQQRELQDDADIVHVAIQSLVKARDRYIQAAHRQRQRLEKILAPQWESRDQVKARIGRDRWENNPNPKFDHARLRQESEAELRQLEKGLQSLQDGSSLDGLSASAQFLKLRLLPDNRHRYNGKRPEELVARGGGVEEINRLEGYPDATSFGWTFTGSNVQSRVEFFERLLVEDDQEEEEEEEYGTATTTTNLVKLDFYYTTGTVKTSLEHPKQGKTQLFCHQDQITPELYVEILKYPRVHTDGQRYQTRANKPPPRGGGGSHRGGRGGRGRGRGGRGRSGGPRSHY